MCGDSTCLVVVGGGAKGEVMTSVNGVGDDKSTSLGVRGGFCCCGVAGEIGEVVSRSNRGGEPGHDCCCALSSGLAAVRSSIGLTLDCLLPLRFFFLPRLDDGL